MGCLGRKIVKHKIYPKVLNTDYQHIQMAGIPEYPKAYFILERER